MKHVVCARLNAVIVTYMGIYVYIYNRLLAVKFDCVVDASRDKLHFSVAAAKRQPSESVSDVKLATFIYVGS